MAKSARSAQLKANNRRLKANVFGPVETARAERLSAKLMELAAAPRPKHEDDDKMDEAKPEQEEEANDAAKDTAMDVDGAKPATTSRKQEKNRIAKRHRSKSASKHVFAKWKNGKKVVPGRK